MKSKIVIRGTNAQDERCLIAIALRSESNKIDIWTFPDEVATEDFYQKMMKEWRDGEGMEFPEPYTYTERELSLTESLLPDDLKVDRSDVIQRAQTEWHFIVLSSKLHIAYKEQLDDLKEKVDKLEKYEQATWDTLKEFWDKLQEQVRERNLFRTHADTLRDHANSLFAKMKELRSKMDSEFDRVSQETADTFYAALADIEKKLESGVRVPVLFDELKKLQRKYRESKFTREHRDKVWEKLDGTFKVVKEKRFGVKPGVSEEGGSAFERLQRRYNGLVSAIEKMEQSIKRDRNDLEFQRHKINTTDGQLEAQIRQAKMVMVDERVRSKEEKLNEMATTKADLEKRLASLKDKETRRAAQAAVKEKIANDIKTAASTVQPELAAAVAAAAALVVEQPQQEQQATPEAPAVVETPAPPAEESLFSAVAATLGESFGDVVDTIKAVASVIGDRIDDAVEELKEDIEAVMEPAPAAAEPVEEAVSETASETPAAVEAVSETASEMPAAVEPVEETVSEAVSETPAEVPAEQSTPSEESPAVEKTEGDV